MAWYMHSAQQVAAPSGTVFAYYVDPSTWGKWAHNTRGARATGAIVDGAAVEVEDGFHHTWTVRAADMQPGRRIVYVNQLPGVTITSTYDVEPAPDGSAISHTIEMRGPWELAYRPLQPLYGHLLRLETRRLAQLAERGAPGA